VFDLKRFGRRSERTEDHTRLEAREPGKSELANVDASRSVPLVCGEFETGSNGRSVPGPRSMLALADAPVVRLLAYEKHHGGNSNGSWPITAGIPSLPKGWHESIRSNRPRVWRSGDGVLQQSYDCFRSCKAEGTRSVFDTTINTLLCSHSLLLFLFIYYLIVLLVLLLLVYIVLLFHYFIFLRSEWPFLVGLVIRTVIEYPTGTSATEGHS
jgi:hypothetical protein